MNEPRAMYRTTDPATSREAANHVDRTGKAKSQRLACLTEVKRCPGQTAAEIAHQLGLERHAPSRRLPQLEEQGLVEKGPPRTCKIQGTRSVTWRLVGQPDIFKPMPKEIME